MPSTTAQRKLIEPWVKKPGMFTPKSWLTAQPTVNPPAVAKLACARLTMPPMPVATTNERKITAMASPCAMTVWS